LCMSSRTKEGQVRRVRFLPALCFVVTAAVLLLSVAWAQVLYGTIVGHVRDTTGAVIPGASVTVTNVLTSQSQEVITNDLGLYTARNLQPGRYDVKVSLIGFRESVQTEIQVTANTVTRVDANLEIGELSDSITVRGQGTQLLQTDKSEVKTEMTTKEITDLPGNLYRNYQSLMDLVPGATPTEFQNATMDLPQRSLTTNVGGQSRNSNNTRLDGVNNMMAYFPHQTLYVAPQETVQTVNVSTNSFDAEQGIAGGAAITVQTKSGTNQFHGVGFGYLQNSALSAKNYFTPAESNVPKHIVSMFGGTFGGPIVENKLFFFSSFEGMKDRRSYTAFTTIPTMAMRQGDFSATGVRLYDPLTGNPDGTGRSEFPGAIIPQARISDVAKKMFAMLPEPNQPGFTDNYYASAPMIFDRNNYDLKADWVVSPITTFWGKYSLMNAFVSSQAALGLAGGPALSDGGAGVGTTRIQLASLGSTHAFTPSFLLDGSIGFSRYGMSGYPESHGTNWGLDHFGIPGTNGTDPMLSGLPMFSITGYSTLGESNNWMPLDRRDNTYVGSFNASWIKRNHDIRFGIDMDSRGINHWQAGTGGGAMGPRGGFGFTGGVTALRGGTSPNRFNSMADFVLGLPNQVRKTGVGHAAIRESVYGLYFRDRWQATRNFTLNLGLRWEYYTMPTRDHRGIERYDPDENVVYLGGIGGIPEDLGYQASKKGFGPRLGVAYRIGGKSVIRSGYGITIDPFSIGRAMRNPYPINVDLELEGPNTFQPYAPISTGISPVVFPDITSGVIPQPPNVTVTFLRDGVFPRGYIQSWNLMYERTLPFSLVGSVGYVATRGVRQRTTMEWNVAPPGAGAAARPYRILFGRNGSTREHLAWKTTVYDSLQATLNRRFEGGLYLKTAYTWGKAIGYNDDSNVGPMIQHPDFFHLNRAVQSYDRTHVFRQAFVYELPFAKWAQHGLSKSLFGGWQINGIFSAYSGTPFTVTASNASLGESRLSQFADQVLPEVKKLGGIGLGNPWLDPNAFKPVTVARFGTAGRNSLRGPGVVNMDMALFRAFRVSEEFELQFRAEAFNISNTPHFLNPNANASNPGTLMTITRAAQDQRNFRFGLRLSF
jgi:hypothetical protein